MRSGSWGVSTLCGFNPPRGGGGRGLGHKRHAQANGRFSTADERVPQHGSHAPRTVPSTRRPPCQAGAQQLNQGPRAPDSQQLNRQPRPSSPMTLSQAPRAPRRVATQATRHSATKYRPRAPDSQQVNQEPRPSEPRPSAKHPGHPDASPPCQPDAQRLNQAPRAPDSQQLNRQPT